MGLTKSKAIAAALSFGIPYTSIPVGKDTGELVGPANHERIATLSIYR